MHDAPRFWHTRNIATLASQDEAVKQNYVQGIIAFSIFLMSFYLLWLFCMLYFKVRGYKKFGCWAGQMFYKKDVEKKETSYKKYQAIQYMFIVAIFGVFFGSTLLLKMGVPFLAQAVYEISDLNQDLQNTLMEGKVVATYTSQGIQGVKDPLTELSSYLDIVGEFCPDENAVNTYKIDATISDMVDLMSGVKDFLERYEVEGLETNLEIMLERSSTLNQVLDTYTDYDWVVRMYTCIVGVLSLFFFVFTLSGWCNVGNHGARAMASYFVVPVFVVMVSIGWIMTIFFAVGSTMNSDFCVGDGVIGPEATIEEALLQYGIAENHLMFQSFLYYKSDCTRENPWDTEVTTQLVSIHSSIDMAESILSNQNEIKDACGDDINAFIGSIDSLKDSLQVLQMGFEKGLEISSCSKVLPLYRRVFNGASCEESLKGLSWSFFAMFSVALSGILMISFRSALYKIKAIYGSEMRSENDFIDDDLIEWEEFSKNQQNTDSSSVGSELREIKQKESITTQITFTACDEEQGVEVMCFEGEIEAFPLSPTSRSNQSSIDTNEFFNDDGVNSFNSELEPLTPSPLSNCKSVGRGKFAPVEFNFNQKKSLSRTSAYAEEERVQTTPGKSISKGDF